MAITKAIPKVPSIKGTVKTSLEEFSALKVNLDGISSWNISPNSWEAIKIEYSSHATEAQARAFLSAIKLPNPEM